MTKGNSTIEYRCIADVKTSPVDWIWKGWFAKGKVSIIAGDPGLGKSQLAISIASIISAGGTFPANDMPCNQGGVILLSAEDDASDTIRPRLEACEANLDLIFTIDAVKENTANTERSFEIKNDMITLGKLVEQLQNKNIKTSLIIIDPISAYLGKINAHNNAEVRYIMKILSDFAAKYRIAIVGISHLRKSRESKAIALVSGSMAFVAAARTAFMVERDSENRENLLFLPSKNNLYSDKFGLSFKIEPCLLAGGIETSRVIWSNKPVPNNIDELMSNYKSDNKTPALDDAKEFLLTLLANGAVPANQIKSEANEAGHAWNTVRRAKDNLKVQVVKCGMKGGWIWMLPSNDAPKVPKHTEDAHQ